MDIRIEPSRLCGSVLPPSSKSLSHRLLIAAALSEGVSTLKNIAPSEDISATLRCICELGARYEKNGNDGLRICGIGKRKIASKKPPLFDCGESGSTLRFFIPIALALCGHGIFTGHGRLMQRPQGPYFELFDGKNIKYKAENDTLCVNGKLAPGVYRLPGNVSSQFFTGLLFALPLLDGDSIISATTPAESLDYILMTENVLRRSGINVTHSDKGCDITVKSGSFAPFDTVAEADWSQAAFWYAARHLGADVKPVGLDCDSLQGDRVISSLSKLLKRSGEVEIDVSAFPDLLPPLAVMAAVRKGKTRFVHALRLRFKESDRLHTVCKMINSLGGYSEEGTASLAVYGTEQLEGGTVNGEGDHRIVMAAAVAACRCRSEVRIIGADAVNKSYPDFFKEYSRLGGKVYVI